MCTDSIYCYLWQTILTKKGKTNKQKAGWVVAVDWGKRKMKRKVKDCLPCCGRKLNMISWPHCNNGNSETFSRCLDWQPLLADQSLSYNSTTAWKFSWTAASLLVDIGLVLGKLYPGDASLANPLAFYMERCGCQLSKMNYRANGSPRSLTKHDYEEVSYLTCLPCLGLKKKKKQFSFSLHNLWLRTKYFMQINTN